MSPRFGSFSEIINAFENGANSGPIVLALQLDEEPGTVRQWRNRDVLPDRVWAATVAAAGRLRIEGVTLEVLAGLAAKKAKAA